MKKTITGHDFCAMIEAAAVAISLEKQVINDLNVFPVPDGDTGTNLSLTMGSAATEIKKRPADTVGAAAEVAASALLRGARGNSGVILSLLFRGLSKGLKDAQEANTLVFAQSLVDGVEAAYKAVMKPAEGTMLTVSRVASAAALEHAKTEQDMIALFEHTLTVGYEALAETINQNPVLKKAGVIDAGGKGYLIILGGMLSALKGEEIVAGGADAFATPAIADTPSAEFEFMTEEDITFMYCTELIVCKDDHHDLSGLNGFLDGIGDSLVVVEDDTIIKIHVHTDEPGRVLSEALKYGALIEVKIENMREQAAQMAGTTTVKPPEATRKIAAPEKPFGIVAISAGDGLTEVLGDLGVDQIVTGGQTMNPSTDDILKAIDATPAETVYVLPNNKNIILAAQMAVPLSEKNVIVIPTQSVPQGISALLTLDPGADIDATTAEMESALTRVKTAQITYASRDSDFDGKQIKEGQYLTLLDNNILGSADTLDAVIGQTIAAVTSLSPTFITIFYGEDITEEDAEATRAEFATQIPAADVTVIRGGQPVYYYMISAE